MGINHNDNFVKGSKKNNVRKVCDFYKFCFVVTFTKCEIKFCEMKKSLQIIVCLSQLPFHMLAFQGQMLLLNQLLKTLQAEYLLGPVSKIKYLQLTEGLGRFNLDFQANIYNPFKSASSDFSKTMESVSFFV